MAIGRDGAHASRLQVCLDAAADYHFDRREAVEIIDHQTTVISGQWSEAADACALTDADRAYLWRRQILNPSISYGYAGAR